MTDDGFCRSETRCAGKPWRTRPEALGGRLSAIASRRGKLKKALISSLCAVAVGGLATRVRADASAINFETPTYMTGSINGQDGWSATGAYDYGVAATAVTGFGSQSFRISNAITSGSFGDWAFSKSLTDGAGEPGAANGGFSGGTLQPHFEVSFDIASTVPGAEQPGLQISVAPDRGDGARMSFLRFSDTSTGLQIDFADYQDVAPFGKSSNLAAGCSGADDFVTTTVASGLSRLVPHNVKLVMDFVPGPRNDVVRVFVDGALVHCGTTWEDFFRYCEATDDSRTVDSLLLQARSGGGTAPATLGFGFLVDNLNLVSGPLVSEPAVCPTATATCAAPACATPNCLVNDATGVDVAGCCTTPLTPCKTIQFAVGDAAVGDVVSVAAGTYPETGTGASPLNINKALTLCGAQAGVDARTRVGLETHITDPQGTIVSANDVVIDGFTIEGNVTSVFVYGLDMAQGTTGTQVYNNIIQNNIAGIGLANTGVSQVLICQNLIQNNNNPGSASGTGIYTDEYVCGFALPCTNFLIEQNAFKGNVDAGIDISNTNPPNPLTQLDVSTNTFDMNGRGIILFNTDMSTIHNNSITNCTTAGSGAIRIFGSVDNLTITSNDLNTGAGWGIRMTDSLFPPTTPNSGVVIHLNNIANFAGSGGPFGGGLFVGAGAHVGPVNAECNWWDDPCGPYNVAANPLGPGEEVEEAGAPGDADFTPWLIAPGPAPASGGGTCTGMMCVATTTTTTVQTTTTTTTVQGGTTTTTVQGNTTTTVQGGTTTTTVASTTTTTTLCTPLPENTSAACGDQVDNDCDGLIDCFDPDCTGIFPCPRAGNDPTSIRFGRNGSLDLMRGHAKLEMAPVNLTLMPVSVLLSNARGAIYSDGLPDGALTASPNGKIFSFRNSDARTNGGMYSLKIKKNNDNISYTFSFTSYGDLSAATDPNMRLQFYIGGDANAARDGRIFITRDQPWTRTARGWRAPKDH